MKIVFIDLHCNIFLIKPFNLIFSKSKVNGQKYNFLLIFLIKNGYEVVNYITPNGSTLGNRLRSITGCQLQRKIENDYVLIKNSINPMNVKTIFSVNKIDKDDIVIAFFHYSSQIDLLNELSCFKVVLGNHFIRISSNSNLSMLGVNIFANEIDATRNDFINKFFNLNNVKSVVVPYVSNERFRYIKGFRNRKRKAMAIGTLATTRYTTGYDKYVQWSGTEWVQPRRKEILENAELLTNEIDSYISYLYEGDYKINKASDSIIRRLKNKYHNIFYATTQPQYTSFDMVNKFNDYMMFVCPEEFAGVPGIGTVEGLSCGTAYIGLNHDMYRDWGMIPGVHYISYDGTLNGLTEKINYYQNHIAELETIAQKGYEFAQLRFNSKAVAQTFIFDILNEQKAWRKSYDET